jgi:hypothetical protein
VDKTKDDQEEHGSLQFEMWTEYPGLIKQPLQDSLVRQQPIR